VAAIGFSALAGGATACTQPQRRSGDFYDVREFGARSDGKTKSTGAIQRAIDAAVAGGGGTIFFPAGHFLTGPIHLALRLPDFVLPQGVGAGLRWCTGQLARECVHGGRLQRGLGPVGIPGPTGQAGWARRGGSALFDGDKITDTSGAERQTVPG